MLADRVTVTENPWRSVAMWLLERVIYELHHLWACCWWALRAHVAAVHGFPRSCLEDPPAEWLRVLQEPGERDL